MNRRDFLFRMIIGMIGMASMSKLGKTLADQADEKIGRMPVLFVGHGNPMNAIEDNEFSRAWEEIGRDLPRPKAVLCVSAHWETNGSRVTAMEKPRTIHDFYGFPDELNAKEYPAPGAPEWAEKTRKILRKATVKPDLDWGLDHGTWAVLCRMFPKADVPTFQLSLDRTRPAQDHYDIGRELAPLRDQGVLIVGSGNMVHNLRLMEWRDKPFDWATRFDSKLRKLIEDRDHKALINYKDLGQDARLAIPTNEHYLPLLYTLALQNEGEKLSFFTEKVTLGSISMRGLRIG